MQTNSSPIAAVLAVSEHGSLILASRGSALLKEWAREFAGDALRGLAQHADLRPGLWLYTAEREIPTPESEAEDSPEWRAWLSCSFEGGYFRRLTDYEAACTSSGEFDWL